MPTTTTRLRSEAREPLSDAGRRRLLAHWNELVGALPPDLAHRRPCLLGPPEAFSDQPAPASYFNDWTGHDPARMGPSSIAVARRLASSCAGWPRRPSAAEFYAAVHADRPDARQQQLIAAWAQEAAYLDIIDAWGEHVYTIRELVAAFHKVEGLHTFTRFRWLNHMALVPRSRRNPAVELLTLPEPAATLWRRAGPALERALAQTERPPARWSIGGGTILACRWGHRESTDIDLTAPGRCRARKASARHLFDIAVAHHADPDALAQAANMLGEDEIRQVRTHWRINAHRLAHEAGATLAKVSPEYEPERRDVVARATARLEDARYQAVSIRETQGGLTIETRTAGRPPTTIRTGHDDAADTRERTGMGEFLNRHTAGGRRRVTQEAAAARARGGTETTILDWQRPAGSGAAARGSPP